MKHFWLLLLVLIVGTQPVSAQVAGTGRPRLRLVQVPARDTLLVRPLRLGMTRLPPLVPIDFRAQSIDQLLFTKVAFSDYVRIWAVPDADWSLPGMARASGDEVVTEPSSPVDLSALFLPPVVARDTLGDELLPGALAKYADIQMNVGGYGEMGGSWTRFTPCDPSIHLNCDPGLFPQLKPDVQFSVQVGGTITDRIHVDVDYDQAREETFNSNQINVFYQGLPDEVLQRVEVGDVQFRLPRSRFLTGGVPAGNFGFMATGQVGPVEWQTVWAQQRGDLTTREFRLAGGGTEGLVQEDQIVLDDADYVKGQFFFLFDPSNIAGYPHIDALFLQAPDAPATLRPVQGGVIEVFRDERIPPASNQQQTNLFLANAVSADGTLKHSGQFRRLEPDQDYIVHQSGLWIMLRSPLRQDEALAVVYVTESGATVGTLNAEQSPPGVVPELRLLRSPVANHQPGRPTWDLEMHQVYRVVGSSGLDLTSLNLSISLGDVVGGKTFRSTANGQVTFLRLFGLDEEAPTDRVDAGQVFQPDALLGGVQGGSRISGTYIMFPTLRPFLDPPAVPSAGLTAAQVKALLAGDVNDVIYENPDPVIRDGAGRFRINLSYRLEVEGLVNSFNLGVFGIRDGSERITIGDQVLTRDTDYTIDYEIGQVTLNNAQTLFSANPNAEIRASWEQRSVFQVAPTSMFGANLTYRLGTLGALNFVGLYQSQKTLFARPQLGTEPAAVFLGGVTADLDLGGAALDRLFSRLGMRTDGGANVRFTGELAGSAADPNRKDEGYFEDFESTEEIAIDPRRQQWKLGSRPEDTTGDDNQLPVTPDASNAARLVWQHDFTSPDGAIAGSLVPQRDIDRQINIVGNQLPEPVMWLTFGDESLQPGQRVWRSMTSVLSSTGRDMSRDEFVELYVSGAGTDPLSLVLDFGTTGEDALYVDSTGATFGVYPDGRNWGLGLLDEEARISEREVWGAASDARGLWDQPCQAAPLQAYPLGDERSNCTRGNGIADTEDLDGNGVLDEGDGAYFRYVVRLDEQSQYLVRDTSQTGTRFRLFRIPLRSGVSVNGASQGTWRFIKHLRMTVTGEPAGTRYLAIARMRIVGSSWTKRDVSGIISGLIGEDPSPAAATSELRVGPVSRLTDGTQYSPPPGISDQLQDPTSEFGGSGVEVNEKAQRIAYDRLQADDRAEIYYRYPQQPRSFMNYRQMRLWAVAKEGTWGEQGGERLVIKVGADPRNYYLFQTKLPAAVGSRPVNPADWLPEITVDFERWFELRIQAEERVSAGRIGPDTVWSADSAYAIVFEDRARAPNLASVREFSLAVFNGGLVPIDGEVWVDDIRLDGPVRDPGGAGIVALDLTSDVMSGSITWANRGAVFRQLNSEADYVSTGDFSLNTRTQIDRMLPAAWGLDMPVSVSYVRSARTPTFLDRSDVRAESLTGLRDSGAGSTSLGIRLSKRTPSSNPVLGNLLDPTTITFGYDAARTSTITSRNESNGIRAGIDYQRQIASRDIDILPGFIEDALRAITPAAIENSEFFTRLVSGRFRWTPSRIGFGVNYNDANAKAFRYTSILVDTSDATLPPIESPRKLLQNSAQIGFAPFTALAADIAVRSGRDLLDPEVATQQALAQQALRDARASVAGADIGWETSRSTATTLSFRPTVANWLRPTYSYVNQFQTNRDPSYFEIDFAGGDSVGLLQRRFGSDRQINRRLDFQPAALVQSLAADSSTGAGGAFLDVLGAVQSVSITWNSGLSSQFDRETLSPGLGYQLGLGGIDEYRVIEGDTAIAATERNDFRLGSSAGLPLGMLLSVNYSNVSSDGFDIRGGQRQQKTRTWPSIRLAWRNLPVPTGLQKVFLAASIDGGYEKVDRTNVYGVRSPQVRGSDEARYPIGLSLTFPGGITATYNGAITRGRSVDPTGDGRQDGVNHSLQVSGIMNPPPFLGEKFKSPIQAMLSLTQDDRSRCRFQGPSSTTSECVAYIDTSNRSANFNLDTTLSDIIVGFQLNYTSRQSRVGTQTGSSQFQAKLYGRFNFSSGQVRGGTLPSPRR